MKCLLATAFLALALLVFALFGCAAAPPTEPLSEQKETGCETGTVKCPSGQYCSVSFFDVKGECVPYTEDVSERIALDFLKNDETFKFDGNEVGIGILEPVSLNCSCKGWHFAFTFESAHAGYGDRSGEVLAQVITKHRADIEVKDGIVTYALLDGRWDMLTEAMITGEEAEGKLCGEIGGGISCPNGYNCVVDSDRPAAGGRCEPVTKDSPVKPIINAKVDEEFEIRLSSNPSTGYDWQVTIEDESILEYAGSECIGCEADAGKIVGAGHEFAYNFKALKAGHTKIHMDYARPWESVPPLDSREFAVTVS